MPAPAGAIVGALRSISISPILAVPNVRASVPSKIAYVLIVALLMASRIPHFSGKGSAGAPEYVIVVLFGFVTCIFCLPIFPMEMLILCPSSIWRPSPRHPPLHAYAAEDAARQAGVAATQAAAHLQREHDRPHSRRCGCSATPCPDDECTSIKASGAERRPGQLQTGFSIRVPPQAWQAAGGATAGLNIRNKCQGRIARISGTVIELLPNATFASNSKTTTRSSLTRREKCAESYRVLPGDKVLVEMTLRPDQGPHYLPVQMRQSSATESRYDQRPIRLGGQSSYLPRHRPGGSAAATDRHRTRCLLPSISMNPAQE